MRKVGIGIIGCGNISTAYLKAAQRFPILDVRALPTCAARRRNGDQERIRIDIFFSRQSALMGV